MAEEKIAVFREAVATCQLLSGFFFLQSGRLYRLKNISKLSTACTSLLVVSTGDCGDILTAKQHDMVYSSEELSSAGSEQDDVMWGSAG